MRSAASAAEALECDDQPLTGLLGLTAAVAQRVSVPVIASGGVGTLAHLYDGFVTGKADAVLAASIFHFRTYTIREAKAYLRERGVPVREALVTQE